MPESELSLFSHDEESPVEGQAIDPAAHYIRLLVVDNQREETEEFLESLSR